MDEFAVLFGVGWGLVGLCPGPAVSGLALGRYEIVVFVIAMLVGMLIQRFGPWRVPGSVPAPGGSAS